MQVFQGIEQFNLTEDSLALTIGNFDGVHRGHQAILARLQELSGHKKVKSALISFDPHPAQVLSSGYKSQNIQTQSQFKLSLQSHGLDYLIIEKFDKIYSQQSADLFFNRIFDHLKFKFLLIGYDFKFGKKQAGDFTYLQKKSQSLGFQLIQLEPFKLEGNTISSSLIRDLLRDGLIKKVNQFLGHPYAVNGKVVSGKGNGKKLGFPTINLASNNDLFLKAGVYHTEVLWNKKSYPSITNFGRAPTVNGEREQILETHLLNFDQDLYGEEVKIIFCDFIREEKKFASLDQLVAQIHQDISSLQNKNSEPQ